MLEICAVFVSAFWLGILTSISPCPLASNIAAVSFLTRKLEHIRQVVLSGVFYTLGRMITYAALGFIIMFSVSSVPVLARFLQSYMNKILGPVLIVAGLFLLNIIRFSISGFSLSEEKKNALASSGIYGAFGLGVIFALSFCPISAALFFGSLIPLALSAKVGALLPFIYGIGTGLPVLVFALFVAFGVKSVAQWFSRVSKLEIYARMITGVIFVAVGIYYAWTYLIVGYLL